MLGAALLGAAVPTARAEDDRGLGCPDQVAPIEAGFGRAGPHAAEEREVAHPGWPGRSVHLFLPRGAQGPVPVVFFAHGFGATQPIHYRRLLEHLVSRGQAVVYAPYKTAAATHRERYEMLWAGFLAGAEQGAGMLDLSRVGFLGHSFGGGATPELARRGLLDEGWGSAGSFVMVMAPWYVLQADEAALRTLPERTRVLVQVYEDERVNDHRIAIELFHALGERTAKSFVLVRSDARGLCRLSATHTTPATDSLRGRVNGLDRDGVFRLADALAADAFADAFADDAEARRLLFPGQPRTLPMGIWPDGTPVTPAEIDPRPTPVRPATGYYFSLGAKQRWMRATELGF